MTSVELARIRQQEQREAATLLGVKEVVFLGMADQQLEETPVFREEIVRLIRRFRPKIVLSSDPYRRYLWHRDHRIVGQVVMDAGQESTWTSYSTQYNAELLQRLPQSD